MADSSNQVGRKHDEQGSAEKSTTHTDWWEYAKGAQQPTERALNSQNQKNLSKVIIIIIISTRL